MTETTPTARRRWLRMLWFLLPVLAFVGVVTAATLNADGAPKPGDAAPAFDAALLTGEGRMSLESLRGKPVVLNFWASWCIPCRDEAPMLKRVHDEFGDRVHVVGVDVKDSRTDALAFMDEFELEYPSVRDEDGSLYSRFGLTGQPETFFIDHEGVIVEHVSGPLFEEDLLLLIQGLMARSG